MKIQSNTLIIKKGKSLSVQTMKQINKIWQNAFPGNEPVEPKTLKLFAEDMFFILYNPKKKILSVGRLRPIKIKFMNKFYKIQGSADLVSVIKKKGYGKAIKLAMRKHLKNKKQTSIGFCERKNSLFYQKCGFKIAKNLVSRFLYKNPKGELIKDPEDNDVLYLEGKNKLMKKILSHPKEKVLIPCLHW